MSHSWREMNVLAVVLKVNNEPCVTGEGYHGGGSFKFLERESSSWSKFCLLQSVWAHQTDESSLTWQRLKITSEKWLMRLHQEALCCARRWNLQPDTPPYTFFIHILWTRTFPDWSSLHLTAMFGHSGRFWRNSEESSAALRTSSGLQGCWDSGDWKSMKPGLN